jgi:hypothetical protein
VPAAVADHELDVILAGDPVEAIEAAKQLISAGVLDTQN